jgi:hypothetical protein
VANPDQVGKRAPEAYFAWNVAVPAAAGFVPVFVLLLIRHPPYPPFDSWGNLVLLTLPVCGLATGLLGLRRGSVYLATAGSFWVAQSLAVWLSVCSGIAPGASCGLSTGIEGLAFAAVLAAALGTVPLTVVYAIATRTRHR